MRRLEQERTSLSATTRRLERVLEKQSERALTVEMQLSTLIHAMQSEASGSATANLSDRTAQERYWAGPNGVRYVLHHLSKDWAVRLPVWREVLNHTGTVDSVIELGCNVGDNLRALSELLPSARLVGVELNAFAVEEARSRVPSAAIKAASLLDYDGEGGFDLAFTRGVLIHINPDALPRAYEQLDRLSHRYVLIYEHFSAEPYTLDHYATDGRTGSEEGERYQFWRDFAAEFETAQPSWKRIAEGPDETEKTQGALVWTLFARN